MSAKKNKKLVEITINQRKFKVEEGRTILEIAQSAGIEIPTMCHHSALTPYGACRLCLVEITAGGRLGLTASCQYKVREGLVVETDTELVVRTRKIMFELLLARTPKSTCLLDLAGKYGVEISRIKKKKTDDCILCGLCVRVCRERMGQSVLTFYNRGSERAVGPAFDKKSPICIGCGACEFICPTGAVSAEDTCEEEIIPLYSKFESGIGKRPVINIMYPQAVPNAPVIDKDYCVFFNQEDCKICESVCEAKAIDYTMKEKKREIEVGAVILNPGFSLFDPKLRGEYGFGVYPNVLTSRQFERILSASGPTKGEIVRPSDNKHPKKIAFISCVGSRDSACGNEYCSSVCCMYSTKEAIIAKEHESEIKPTIFYMDIRAFGKGFDRYYESAKNKYGIRYIRSLPSRVVELTQSNNLRIRFKTGNNGFQEEEFDMVVLATGINPPEDAKRLAEIFGLEVNEYGFCQRPGFSPTETTNKGVFIGGAFGEPKDIPETVIEASSAAAEASQLLASSRGTLTVSKEYPRERPFLDEEPRIGVFVCRCGRNIGGVVDVPSVVEYARTLPHVVYADENLYTCSQDSLEIIKAEIEKNDLTRVVVASCTPTTHAPLFRETIREVGLNPYLFELASLREHVSWVHMNEPEKATAKAKKIVAMATAKASLLVPIKQGYFDLNKEGLVIGGGLSGMTAALSLAEQGFRVHLVEKTENLGGHLNDIYYTIDGKNPQELLKKVISEVEDDDLIHIYREADVKDISGYLGNFTTTLFLRKEKETIEVPHGIVIIATGAKENKSEEYLYGKNPHVLTQTELEKKLGQRELKISNKIVMIQCVGSRDEKHPYCSRVCCSQAVKNALKVKELSPESEVVVLYRDIRTYGFKEKYYLKARRKGVLFIRYDENKKPQVTEKEGKISVLVTDSIINEDVVFQPDLLVLSTGIQPDNEELSRIIKLPLTEDGFFMEAHAKIRPLDFTADGIFLAGLAHSPRFIEEAVAQAKGATIRAATILSKDKILAKAEIPTINAKWCSGCGICERLCPYDARRINPETHVAEVVEVLCQGCGACVMGCPNGACQQQGFEMHEIFAMIDAGLET